MNPNVKRLRELDFLRGIAILLVLLRHQHLCIYTSNMGWIGVDLFFVLSGFLVSGLLFREYQKFGDINPGRFLIRRGFKIYPIYYLSYVVYILPLLLNGTVVYKYFLSDVFFVQNYVFGWGYAYAASWSLAIEEHFYVISALSLWIGLKKKMLPLDVQAGTERQIGTFEKIILAIMLVCLLLRIWSNYYHPLDMARNFTMTHLRIDSLLTGVLIAYLYYFKRNYLQEHYLKYSKFFSIAVPALLAFTPFIEPVPSFFAKTIGFLLVSIAFGIVLISFLMDDSINLKLNKYLGDKVVTLVSKIGFCSYAIYIVHTFVNRMIERVHLLNHYLKFICAISVSVIIGMFITHVVEDFFLKIRDKYFPSR